MRLKQIAKIIIPLGLILIFTYRIAETVKHIKTYLAGHRFNLSSEYIKAKVNATNLNQLRPSTDDWVDFLAGKKVFIPEDWMRYRKYYLKIIDYFPQRADAQGLLGYCSYQLKDNQQAIGYYQKAVALNPQFFWYYYNLGLLYFKDGNINGAVEVFEKALKLPQEPTFRFIQTSANIYMPIVAMRSQKHQYSFTQELLKARINMLTIIAYIYAQAGQDKMAVFLRSQVEKMSKQTGYFPIDILQIPLESY